MKTRMLFQNQSQPHCGSLSCNDFSQQDHEVGWVECQRIPFLTRYLFFVVYPSTRSQACCSDQWIDVGIYWLLHSALESIHGKLIDFWKVTNHLWFGKIIKDIPWMHSARSTEWIFRNYSNAGQKSAEGRFLSKLVYKFLPSQNLVHLSHHRGGGQLPKNTYETL